MRSYHIAMIAEAIIELVKKVGAPRRDFVVETICHLSRSKFPSPTNG